MGRIGNLSNADISDFFVYRIVYRIEPPISSISIFSKPMIFLSLFAENSENSPKILKIRRKFLKKKVFFEALISYRIVSYREKNPIATGWSGPPAVRPKTDRIQRLLLKHNISF